MAKAKGKPEPESPEEPEAPEEPESPEEPEPPEEPEAPEEPEPPKPQPHPLEERVSKLEADNAQLRAERDRMAQNAKKSPLLKRFWEALDKPIL